MKEFKNKVAVITGAASGIGRGIAERCLLEGMKVVLADIDEEELSKTSGVLAKAGGTVTAIKTDVSKRHEIERLAEKTIHEFGSVHLLFNNAGVAAGSTPWQATYNDWEWVIGVNLWGVIHGVKVFTPIMLAQNTECYIVNTASIAGLIANHGSNTPYYVSKHAVVALSEGLYLSLQQSGALVKVAVLCPGLVNTNIIYTERHRPAELQNAPRELSAKEKAVKEFAEAAVKAGLSPSHVADQVFEAIQSDKFYILTDEEYIQAIRLRVENLLLLENPKNPTETIINIAMRNM
ncbi:MAG: SDR family NAD(P)-dependent oxidoreductase [Desulfobacteraceae bacterium]|nr:SDR family NAD(P)-dependent oxidoreductase [Desulfobacteraceae bacterium]